MPVTCPDPALAILVFAKAPVAGTVKTRLIPLLGAEGAAALQRQLLAHALGVAHGAAEAPVELWCAPDTAHPFLQTIAAAHGATLRRQLGDDLGARMAHAFTDTLQRHERAICIGADCPALTARHLREADAALRNGNDAVFVPAEDGGYALVGLARRVRDIFDGIAWGGPRVMTQTRARMRTAGVRWHELETLWDIDRPQDYHRLQQSGLLDDAPSPV